ncbi:MAG: E3 ubiquitin protein ligase [Bacteroidetes bacterium]|nr:E3 ubiquitin protein ligase [Bacteroidota bacterium]
MQHFWNSKINPEPDKEKCSICWDNLSTTNVSITECGHHFHTTCLFKAFNADHRCPLCRTELMPEKTPKVQPVTVSIATELICEQEHSIDLVRRIEMIHSFRGATGRSSMIVALCRELAFSTAHSIAKWQKTSDETYDTSWRTFDYDESDTGSEADG